MSSLIINVEYKFSYITQASVNSQFQSTLRLLSRLTVFIILSGRAVQTSKMTRIFAWRKNLIVLLRENESEDGEYRAVSTFMLFPHCYVAGGGKTFIVYR